MSNANYTFTISPSGETKMEYEGKTGSDCIEATKEIEIALGGTKIDEGKTSDYYKPEDPQDAKNKW